MRDMTEGVYVYICVYVCMRIIFPRLSHTAGDGDVDSGGGAEDEISSVSESDAFRDDEEAVVDDNVRLDAA